MRVPWSAVLVHVFTALGVVCALLATRAALAGAWEEVFFWLGVALAIDGVDGTFARLVEVSSRLPRFSGERMDLVIDYITYVFVPALALLQAGYLPGGFGVVLASLILMSSLFHFADTESKTDDHCFVGFPAVWQMPLLVFLTFDPPVWVTVASILLLGLGQFTWLKFIHPVRTVRWRRVNLSVCLLWVVLGGWSVWESFEPPQAVRLGLLASSVWLLVVGIVMQLVPERRAIGAE